MKARLLSAALTVALLAGAASAYVLATGSGEMYTVTAEIDQAPNLFSGARVMVRGVEVGKVIAVDPTPSGVGLTLEIQKDVRIPADATLAVIPVTVISDRYVQFFPAYSGGPSLEDGAHLSMDRTSIPAELDDVLTQLQGLLEALEPKKEGTKGSLARLVDSLDKIFADRDTQLAGALENGAVVLENLADSESNIVELIGNLDNLFLALANRSSEIGIVNERFQLVAEALLADQDNLEGTIENIAFLSDEVAGLLETSGDELGSSFRRLGNVLRTILKHQDELAAGIEWSNVIAQTLGATDGSGKGLYAYSGKQGAVGGPQAAYNYRLDSRDVITCERLEQVSVSVLALTPSAGVDDVLETALSYIPDFYDSDLSFLIRLLIENCVEFNTSQTLEEQAAETLRQIVDQVGEETFYEFLGRWLVEGYEEDGS